MSAPAHFPPHIGPEVEVRWDDPRGIVFVAVDPEAAEMEASIRAGARWAEALFHLLLIAAAILGAACLISQIMKWTSL